MACGTLTVAVVERENESHVISGNFAKDGHVTFGAGCHCRPILAYVCDCESGCWKCDGGFRTVDHVSDFATDHLIVLHLHRR